MLKGRTARAIATVAAALAAAPATAAAAANDDVPDAAAAAAVLGVSKGEAADRLRLQPELGALRADARRLWPDTFAGMWTDHAAGGVTTIAFTEDAERNVAQLRQGFSRPLLLRAASAPRSLAGLDRVLDAVAADREAIRAGRLTLPGLSTPRFDAHVDERRNRVVLTVERPSDALHAAIAARHGDAVVVEAGDVTEPLACYVSNCAASMRSGLRVEDFAGGGCSTGFTTGPRLIFSAAHCGEITRYHGAHHYGEVVFQQQRDRVDAELHRVNQNGFAARAWILDDGVRETRPVTSRGDYSQLGTDHVVCKTGATTGRTCGRVEDLNVSPWYVNSSSHFVRARMCSRAGDSGSGVYIGGQAVGILSGGTGSGSCSSTDTMVFGHIEFAQNALDQNVRITEESPSFWSFRAVGGQSQVTVNFSFPVSCDTVQTSDFSVKIAGAVPVTLTRESCVWDSDSSFVLETSTPMVSNDFLEVAVVGAINDPGGNTVPRQTRSGYVE